MVQNVGDLIHRELSGERAQLLTEEITRFHRPPGGAGYHAATNLVAARLQEAGLSNVVSAAYPLDGRTMIGEGPLPLAWEPYGASVRVVSPVQEAVVDMESVSSCLAWWSTPTPLGGIEAELIDVGTGETEADFEGKDITGKIVLIGHTERIGAWDHAASEAIRRGASGIISDYLFYTFEPYRTRERFPEGVQLLRLPNARGEHDIWACSISFTVAQRLRALLSLGPVHLHADVRCRIFKGTGQNLVATISGSEQSDESVFFVAHTSAATCPCANCAAGPSLMVEIARTLSHLIESGQVQRPRRAIKFLFVIEMLGSRVFIDANPTDAFGARTAFFFDSVGHNQDKLKSALLFYRHPDSSPSFVNDYFAGVMDRAPKDASWVFSKDTNVTPIQFVQAPYTPWSDNHVWARYGVPSPLIMSWPDLYFHTQFLTADNTDPRVFRRAGVTSALAAYEIANADAIDALLIAGEVAARSRFRMDTLVSDTIHGLRSATRSDEEPGSIGERTVERALRKLRYLSERDTHAIASALALVPGEPTPAHDAEVDAHVEALLSHAQAAAERLTAARLDLQREPGV